MAVCEPVTVHNNNNFGKKVTVCVCMHVLEKIIFSSCTITKRTYIQCMSSNGCIEGIYNGHVHYMYCLQ